LFPGEDKMDASKYEGHAKGPWSASPSIPDRGFEAQVWDAEGKALLHFAEGREVGPEADATARLAADAPCVVAALVAATERIAVLEDALRMIASLKPSEKPDLESARGGGNHGDIEDAAMESVYWHVGEIAEAALAADAKAVAE
jgi:hypothetical protein